MHDSGERQSFDTGAVRDAAAGKPRVDLISPFAEARLGAWCALGAAKYSDRNWEKGMPLGRILASLCRHLNAYRAGDTAEDHLAAVMWNAMALAHGEEMVKRGVWAEGLDDLPRYGGPAAGLAVGPEPAGVPPSDAYDAMNDGMCITCLHEDVAGGSAPCHECLTVDGVSNWTPKAPEAPAVPEPPPALVPVEPLPHSCRTCVYEPVPLHSWPCSRCARDAGKPRWTPKGPAQ
jgi:hypothetical protein